MRTTGIAEMTGLGKRIRAAQHRLWFNRWLELLSRCVALAAFTLAAVVLVQRLFGFPWPLNTFTLVAACMALTASLVWLALTREGTLPAAAALDEHAGLRERVSTGYHCLGSQDAFAQAVVQDAEEACASLSVRAHLKLNWPRSLGLSFVACLVALSATLLSPGLLTGADPEEEDDRRAQVRQARADVKREVDALRRIAPDLPELKEMAESEGPLEQQAGGMVRRADDIRHEAVKRIDSLADAVKKRRGDPKFDAMSAMRKRLRGLNVPKSQDAPTRRLSKALKQGDFKTAREEIKKLNEQLATLKSEEDREMVAKLSAQLENMSKQLENLAKQGKLAAKLNKLGLSEEAAKRLLENLRKTDLDQLAKKLSKDGMDPEKIKKLMEQLQKSKSSNAMMSKLAEALKKAGQAGAAGDASNATAGLSMAEGQLSDLESLEAEMAQLESTASELQASRDRIDQSSSARNGTGMKGGQGGPGGPGEPGQGRGGLAPEAPSRVSFKNERAKVHTGRGTIIGRFLVDGEQVPGEVSASLSEVVAAAQRDATDRVNRNRVPRQYQKAVKAYFANVGRTIGAPNGDSAGADTIPPKPKPSSDPG